MNDERINELKQLLADSDYKSIRNIAKRAFSAITPEEDAEMRYIEELRQQWREEINNIQINQNN